MLIFSLVVLQVVIFAGLIIMLKRIMTQNVISATRHLDELNQDYTKKEEEAARLLEDAKQKSQEAIAKAKEEAEALKLRIIKDSTDEGDNILKEARSKSGEIIEQADRSRTLLLAEVTNRVAREAIDKAAELIGSILPEKFRRDVHSEWVEELLSGGFDQLKHLSVPKDVKDAKITSAFALNEAERKDLAKKIKDCLGRDLDLKEETDPKIVAGLVVSIGSLVLDGSLMNKIREQAKSAKSSSGE